MEESEHRPGDEPETRPGDEPETGPGEEHEGRHDPMRRAGEEEEERILGTAPSSPDIRKLHLMEPSEEAKAHVPSTVDAMGKDKRREVIGHSYGPSRKSQVMFFVIVGIAIAVIIGGWSLAVSAFDNGPGDTPAAKAPWSQDNAPQEPAVRPQ